MLETRSHRHLLLLTVVGHYEKDLRLLNSARRRIGPQEAALPCHAKFLEAAYKPFLWRTENRLKISDGLNEPGQSLRYCPFLDDEAVERVAGRVSHVNGCIYGWTNRVGLALRCAPNCIDVFVAVVTVSPMISLRGRFRE